jgi:hypothetical protein
MKLVLVTVYCIVMSALSIQGIAIYNHFVNPGKSIFTAPGESINVSSVENKIVMGSMAGNRNLAFGVKNIMEEFLQEQDYTINPYAEKKIEIEILYLDVLKTQTNLSVFHRNSDAVVIRMRAKLIQDDKVKKTVIVEESAEEVSMAALVIDQGGKFNQTNLSSALKKSCESVINKLL